MPSVVFADIDGTLIETCRGAVGVSEATVGARDKSGEIIAVRGERHDALLTLLEATNALVPVTGRSVGALSRVNLRFESYAIVHHGAVILLPNREHDREFEESVRANLEALHEVLESAFHDTAARIAESRTPLRVNRQTFAGRTIEVCVKSTEPDADRLAPEADAIEERWRDCTGVRIHRNGNNLAMLPSTVTKARAVEWVVQRLEADLGPCVRFGVGDSLTDLGFMRRCDFFIVPAGSQIDCCLFGSDA